MFIVTSVIHLHCKNHGKNLRNFSHDGFVSVYVISYSCPVKFKQLFWSTPVSTLPCKAIGVLEKSLIWCLYLAKIEVSDQWFFNPGSNHVKIPMKKEHFFALLLGFWGGSSLWSTCIHTMLWFAPKNLNFNSRFLHRYALACTANTTLIKVYWYSGTRKWKLVEYGN